MCINGGQDISNIITATTAATSQFAENKLQPYVTEYNSRDRTQGETNEEEITDGNMVAAGTLDLLFTAKWSGLKYIHN